jgi:tRNA (cytidine/uridine-2'-O-)-methyltransferase
MNIVLYQPDFAHNLGSIMRLAVCFGVPLHIIEPCGFPLDDKRIRERSLDYGVHVEMHRHASWEQFESHRKEAGGRVILATTKTAVSLYSFPFEPNDWLLFGRESSGVPELIHACADARVTIPMSDNGRSFNVVTSVAVVLSEGLRQTRYACILA